VLVDGVLDELLFRQADEAKAKGLVIHPAGRVMRWGRSRSPEPPQDSG
jgi:hypothetical protein